MNQLHEKNTHELASEDETFRFRTRLHRLCTLQKLLIGQVYFKLLRRKEKVLQKFTQDKQLVEKNTNTDRMQ